jgi:uncharacterized protein YaiE (UPF0345 family)
MLQSNEYFSGKVKSIGKTDGFYFAGKVFITLKHTTGPIL